MSDEQLRGLSNEIKECRKSIKSIKVDLANNNEPYYRRKRILEIRLLGLRIHLRNLENQIIKLLR